MAEFFLNPDFLALAAALVSVPIIIHLINRLRFKRIRWAAMEFLLKAQKRMRRRLIIEQLILLALRCLLVALAGLLVLRFVGFSLAGFEGKPNLHLVLFDDTLSMADQWKENDAPVDAFQVAKQKFLLEKIVQGVSLSSASDRLMIVPLSKLATDAEYQPKVYDHLNDTGKLEELKREIEDMPVSKLHVDMAQAVKKAQEICANNVDARVTLHVLSDFRQKEWVLPTAEGLYKTLVGLGKDYKDMKILLHDAAHPGRLPGQGGYPLSHDNVGLVDLRPSTRVVGKNMPVHFTLTVANYSGREAEVNVIIVDERTGNQKFDVDFDKPMPLKIGPSDTVTVGFDRRFEAPVKAKETHFEYLSARLVTPQLGELDNDGLLQDNVRYAAVEVRDKVPVLVIDGLGAKGREENKDSFYIYESLQSVPGASYQVVYGDLLGGGIAAKALERADLHKFPTIFLLNVPELTPKQLAGLENYVRDGGGVAFFLGPQVNANYYNKSLFKDGAGVFPVPLKATYFPAPGDDPLPPKASDTPQLLLREQLFPDPKTYPIFGVIFDKPEHKDPLRDLPIRRYFQVPRAKWQPEPGKASELATLPNDDAATKYTKAVLDIARGEPIRKLLATDEYAKYATGLDAHFKKLETLVAPGSDKKAYHLALALDRLLTDKGDEKDAARKPNLTEFWASPDPKVQAVRREVATLRDQTQYGDPFVVAGKFGKGKVVAVMTTAGKDWNDFGGGSLSSVLYQPFIWETQNYLSSQGSEGNLAVGTPVNVVVEGEQFKKQGGQQLKVSRTFHKTQDKKPAKAEALGDQFGQEAKGQVVFRFDKGLEPGLYVTELRYADDPAEKPALATYAHVFNVDTPAEGPLQRVSSDDLEKELIRNLPEGMVRIEGIAGTPDDLVSRRSDFSESPWLYLLFLAVLVAEQALAVHLSFHLRGKETEALGQLTRPPARAA
jgi:hypothetical protein